MSSIHATEILDPTWPETWPRTADEIHIFDVHGDVLLKFVRPPEADEESDGSSVEEGDRPQVEEVFDEDPNTNVEAPDTEHTSAEDASPPAIQEPAKEPAQESVQEPAQESVQEPAQPSAQEPATDAQPDDASISSDDSSSTDGLTDVHMRVSSKHLILASTTFRSMLGPNFEEGQRLRTEGSTVLGMGDDDPDACIILLDILHGLTRRVPRSVTLEMLTKLAVLVNYYQMHEAVELFSDTWIDNLVEGGLPETYSPEVISWLCIMWVFHKPVEFKAVSRVIEFGCDETLENEFDEGFPIPAPIIGQLFRLCPCSTIPDCHPDVILAHRAAAIEGTMLIVHNLIVRYSTSEILCPVVWDKNNKLACDSLLLGSLIKGAAAIGIWPKRNAPYHGIVFKDLANQVRELKVFDVCNHSFGKYQSSSDAHGVKDSIEASVSALEGAMSGLNLGDFLPEQAFSVP